MEINSKVFTQEVFKAVSGQQADQKARTVRIGVSSLAMVIYIVSIPFWPRFKTRPCLTPI
jgi:hypothetical protein